MSLSKEFHEGPPFGKQPELLLPTHGLQDEYRQGQLKGDYQCPNQAKSQTSPYLDST